MAGSVGKVVGGIGKATGLIKKPKRKGGMSGAIGSMISKGDKGGGKVAGPGTGYTSKLKKTANAVKGANRKRAPVSGVRDAVERKKKRKDNEGGKL